MYVICLVKVHCALDTEWQDDVCVLMSTSTSNFIIARTNNHIFHEQLKPEPSHLVSNILIKYTFVCSIIRTSIQSI